MPLHRYLRVWFLVASVAACSSDPFSPGERHDLLVAEARWALNGGPAYTVESRISCFCPPHLSVWTRLTVQNGQLVAADPPPPEGVALSLSGWLTVEQLFERIGSSTGDFLKDLTARYDASLGYPLDVHVICKDTIQDCGVRYELRNLILSP